MAEWNWHVALAKKVCEVCDIKNINDFYLGAVLPDTPWTSVSDGATSGVRQVLHLARRMPHSLTDVADPSTFLDSFKTQTIYSDLFRGIYCHLVLDECVNDLWNLYSEADGLQHYRARDGRDRRRVYVDVPAKEKWSDVANYAAIRFGCMYHEFPDSASELSVSALDILQDYVGLTSEQLDSMFPKVHNAMQSMIGNKDASLRVSINFYDAIHSECISKCCRVFSVLDSFR